jgi:long-chain acyl-CoA synthetase
MTTDPVRTTLAFHARTHPDLVAVIESSGRTATFGQLLELASHTALELPSNRRIGVRLDNSIESVAALHAVWSVNSTVVSIGALIPDDEAERRAAIVDAAAIVVPGSPATVTTVAGASAYVPGEAVVMFTSGTTGQPKGTSTPFSAFNASMRAIAAGLGLRPEGRPPNGDVTSPQASFVPISHMGGFLGHLTCWYIGKPLLLCERFSAELVFDLAQRYRLGTLRLTPAMVWDLAQAAGDRALPNIKSASVGTAALPEATQAAFEERYSIPILRNYGSTEFTGAIAFERYEDVVAGHRPASSVGRIAPGVDVRLMNGDVEVASGEVGEIMARSASSMSGYLESDGSTSGVDRGGWIRTGDLGQMVEEQLVIVGRVKELIICGGFNIYPSMIEAAMNRLPGVLDSAVAGLADDRLGEIPVAVVVTDAAPLTVKALRDALRQQLAPYELPRQLVVVHSIPRNTMGKVDRAAVARLFSS